MVRILGILVGFGFCGVAAWSLLWGVVQYIKEPPQATVEARFHEHPHSPPSGFAFEGPFGRFGHDQRQLQRGMQVFRQVCSNCHSLQYVAFRNFADLGYNEAQVRNLAEQWTHKVATVNPTDGSPTERTALPADRIPNPFPNEAAARNGNGNALPPDLSLMAKARNGGASYIYSLLTGYVANPAAYRNARGEALPADNRPSGTLHFNPYFANLNIAMPPPLTDGAVTYADGTPATVDQMAQDVAAFLAWTAEPEADQRKNTGFATLIFLLIGTILAYMAYQNVWAGKKH
jgi:ubiquinol-cytochrome c reductase cytochrome c1 subunit